MDMQLTDRELVELLEYSKDGLMISDDKGKIIYLNQTYRQLTKLRRTAKVGVYMKDLVEQEIIDGARPLWTSTPPRPAPSWSAPAPCLPPTAASATL